MRPEFGIDPRHLSASHLARAHRLLNRLHVALQIVFNPAVALDPGSQESLHLLVSIDRLVGDDRARTLIVQGHPICLVITKQLGSMPALMRQRACREMRADVAMPRLAVMTDVRSRPCSLSIGHRALTGLHPLNGEAETMIGQVPCRGRRTAWIRLVQSSSLPSPTRYRLTCSAGDRDHGRLA